MPNYSGIGTNSYLKVCKVCEICLFHEGGGNGGCIYVPLYEHGFAGMQSIRVPVGEALGFGGHACRITAVKVLIHT